MTTSFSHNGKKGFTLVELMMGTLALSVFVLIIGISLTQSWKAWQRGQAAVQMQQDVSLTMRAISREARRVPVESLIVGSSIGSGSNLITKTGNDLIYKGLTLINDTVTSFNTQKDLDTGEVTVQLRVNDGDLSSAVDVTLFSRN